MEIITLLVLVGLLPLVSCRISCMLVSPPKDSLIYGAAGDQSATLENSFKDVQEYRCETLGNEIVFSTHTAAPCNANNECWKGIFAQIFVSKNSTKQRPCDQIVGFCCDGEVPPFQDHYMVTSDNNNKPANPAEDFMDICNNNLGNFTISRTDCIP